MFVYPSVSCFVFPVPVFVFPIHVFVFLNHICIFQCFWYCISSPCFCISSPCFIFPNPLSCVSILFQYFSDASKWYWDGWDSGRPCCCNNVQTTKTEDRQKCPACTQRLQLLHRGQGQGATHCTLLPHMWVVVTGVLMYLIIGCLPSLHSGIIMEHSFNHVWKNSK